LLFHQKRLFLLKLAFLAKTEKQARYIIRQLLVWTHNTLLTGATTFSQENIIDYIQTLLATTIRLGEIFHFSGIYLLPSLLSFSPPATFPFAIPPDQVVWNYRVFDATRK